MTCRFKEWGRPVAPPQRDVGAALAALSEEDLVRLRAIARLRAGSLPSDMSWSDLLHEAVLATPNRLPAAEDAHQRKKAALGR
jgi:hypothetical protein